MISRQTIVAFSFNAFLLNAAQSEMKEFAALWCNVFRFGRFFVVRGSIQEIKKTDVFFLEMAGKYALDPIPLKDVNILYK